MNLQALNKKAKGWASTHPRLMFWLNIAVAVSWAVQGVIWCYLGMGWLVTIDAVGIIVALVCAAAYSKKYNQPVK
jgi:hypothetical protein